MRTITTSYLSADLLSQDSLGHWQVNVYRNGQLVQAVGFNSIELGNAFLEGLIWHGAGQSMTDRYIPYSW